MKVLKYRWLLGIMQTFFTKTQWYKTAKYNPLQNPPS